MKARTLVAVAAIILTLSPAAVLGDVFENFDQYQPTTLSPWSAGNPWTLSYSSAAYGECFTGAGTTTGVQAIGGAPGSGYTPPNVYRLDVQNNATCFAAAHYVALTAQLNLTSTSVLMTWARIVSSSATSAVNASYYLCGTKVYSALFTGEPTSWTNKTVSSVGQIGTNCALSIRLWTQAGGTATNAYFQVDDIKVKGGDFINSNANLFMVDSQQNAGLGIANKPEWFNITDFVKSYAELDFSAAQPLLYSNLTAPDIHVKFNLGPTLLKLWVVPASYYVQIIPNNAGSNTVWLFNPAIVDTFTISIQDLSNQFGPGTTLTITQGTRVMSSGYTDAQNSYPIWIVPGPYNMTLTNGANVYSQRVNFPSVNGQTIPVQILKYQQGGNCGQICAVNYNAGFDAGKTNIVVTFTDSTGSATSVTDQVWVNTPLGPSQFYTKTWSPGPFASISDLVSCNVNACNATLASSIYVVLIFTDQYGTNQESIPVTGGSLFATVPVIPQGILGWNVVFPTSPSPLNFFAYIIVLVSAASMGALAAKFGVVVVAAEAAVFASAGWLNLANGASLFIFGIALLSFVAWLEHGR